VEAVCPLLPGKVIAVEGKTLRRLHDDSARFAALLRSVSAWATANPLVLGQVATEAKSNEIKAIPQLLAVLHLTGCLVTIDGMGCQTKIAEQIGEQGGDLRARAAGNQGRLATEMEGAKVHRDLAFQKFEADRNTLTYRCLAAAYGAGLPRAGLAGSAATTDAAPWSASSCRSTPTSASNSISSVASPR